MKKFLFKVVVTLCALSVVLSSTALATDGYGDNYGFVEDGFNIAIKMDSIVGSRLETGGSFVAEDYGSVTYSEDEIELGGSCTLTAIPKNEDYKFLYWENGAGEALSTDATYKHTFHGVNDNITAVFGTDLILDIDFDSGKYQAGTTSRMQLVTDGKNKYMKYFSTSTWALTKISYNGTTDVYDNTCYEPNTTYVMTFDYNVVDGGSLPGEIIGIAPHKSLYNGDSPGLRLGISQENIGKWLTKKIYFTTTEATGMGESTLAHGLFQICACKDFEILVDNLKIKKIETPEFPKAENTPTIENYKMIDDKLVVSAGMNVAALRMVVADPVSAKVIDAEGNLLSNETDVTTGTQLVDGDTTHGILVKGDADGGGVTVVDVLKGIDAIFSPPEDEAAKAILDMNDSGTLTVTDIVNIRNTILGKSVCSAIEEMRSLEYSTLEVRRYIDYIRLNSRLVNTVSGIYLAQAAAGIRFSAFCEGDVYANISNAYPNLFFTVYIDGVRVDKRFSGDVDSIKIAEDLEFGYHEFEFIKQNDLDQTCSLDSITLKGTMVASSINPNPTIEFIGDSITSGCGTLYNDEGTDAYKSATGAINSDATSTYAFFTSRALGLDYSHFSRGGRTLVEGGVDSGGNARECIASIYEYTNPWNNKTDLWNFGSGSDIVVVNLGTNDAGCGIAEDDYETAMREFIVKIRNYNPNSKIVWCYGMMNPTAYVSNINAVITDLGGEANGLYECRLPLDNGKTGSVDEGGNDTHYAGHPARSGHEAAAEVLTEFIKTNILN